MDDMYFVILYCQNGRITAMMDESGDEMAIFGTREAAVDAGKNNPLGANFGFEIYEAGTGECC